MDKQNILFLVVKKSPFDVMITGEKKVEYRNPTQWIHSRLFDKQGNKREYDLVCIIHSYSRHAPRFYAEYKGFTIAKEQQRLEWSNKFSIVIEPGFIEIHLGAIVDIKDVKTYDKAKKQMALEF